MSGNVHRVAVIGAGVFGRHHMRVIRESPRAVLAGVYDTDRGRAEEAARLYECPAFASLDEAALHAGCAIAAVPTQAHAEVACRLLGARLDVLVEKPIAPTVDEAHRITAAAARAGRILQCGHLERFNPAVEAARRALTLPLFFEIHRLSVFTPRSLDVDVVADLMIHDLDILLAMTGAPPVEVRAAGIGILTPKVDIANVRLAFANGCVANLTASRVSTERVRKLRLFQPGEYMSVDYAKQECVVIGVDERRQARIRPLEVAKAEPLKRQLDGFLDAVETRSRPLVDGDAATRALEVASSILAKIEEHAAIVAKTIGR
jgi:predicted dehydrogenase